MLSSTTRRVFLACSTLAGINAISLLGGCKASGVAGEPGTSNPFTSAPTRTISEAFTSEKRVLWYVVKDEIGKDSLIDTLYVVEGGGVTVYHIGNGSTKTTSLGNIAGHSDDAVVEFAEEKYEEAFADATYPEVISSHLLRDASVSFVAHTDKTGNAVEWETINFGPDPDRVYGTALDINSPELHEGIVYEDSWVGFDITPRNMSSARAQYLITRDTDYNYVLDDIDSEGVDID